MYTKGKNQLVNISKYAGERADYVQGGGGNTSIKLDNTLMAIKASGYTLKEITADRGYVTVDYQKIRRYYSSVNIAIKKDYEAESLAINLDSVRLLDGMENKRPSVEVGFHSFLRKCVIHTHSVYANILCCSEEGQSIANKILPDLGYIFIPYIDPGFSLTLEVMKAAEAYRLENGEQPGIIFMKNHGIIVHGDDDKSAIALHEKINISIRSHFRIADYPTPTVKKTETGYASNTGYLKAFISEHEAYEAYFNGIKLYPDQLVYIGNKTGSEIRIKNNEIFYETGEREAQAIEETLLGVVFVIDRIKKAGLTLKQMDDKGIAFINEWESEKYRSQVIK